MILSLNINALPEFLETNLPSASMVSMNEAEYKLLRGNEIYNQGWSKEFSGTDVLGHTRPKDRPNSYAGDSNTNTPPSPPSGNVVKEGSGGNYLSNEVFYRVALLREKRNSTVLTGHLHLPVLQTRTNPNFNGVNTKELIQDVRGMVVDGINAI